ncbi:MAG: MFS transporter [Pseudooceanicola sp.]
MPYFTLLSVPFVFTLGGFVFAGLLAPMAADLGVPVAAAGLLQAAYALACALAGPVLARITRGWRRRPLLLGTLGVMLVLNAASALAPGFGTLLGARAMIGGFGALALPLATAIAVALVAPAERPRAIARVYAGVAFALMLGMPLGSLVGEAFGWRASFWLATAACAVSLLLCLRNLPDLPALPQGAGGGRLGASAFGHLGVTLLAFTAMFALVGFIGPVITGLTGLGGTGIAAFQVAIGLSSLAGLKLGARIAARPGAPALPLFFAGIAIAMLVLVHPLAAGMTGGYGAAMMALSVALAPLCLFGTAPVVQSRLAASAGPAVTFAFALNGSMVYLGQGLGVALGAAAISAGGLSAAPMAGGLMAIAGIALGAALTGPRTATA